MFTTLLSRISSYMSAIMVFVVGLAIYLFALLIHLRKKHNTIKTVFAEIVRIDHLNSADTGNKNENENENKYNVVFAVQDNQTLAFSVDVIDIDKFSVGMGGMLTYKGKHFVGFDAEIVDKNISED